MRISNSHRLMLATVVAGAALSATLFACSSDDSSTSSGSGGNEDSGSTADAGTLYSRLGGHAGIAKAIGDIVTKELTYPDIASFFAPNLENPSHMPQPADIEECFTDLLGKAAGGPETYPTTTAGGFTCRDMATAHAALHIGNGTFDEFVTIAAGVLAAAPYSLSTADLTAVGGVLNSTKTLIVDTSAPDGGSCISPACDAGVIADSATGG